MGSFWKRQKDFLMNLIAGLVMIGILLVIPTGFEDALLYRDAERSVCLVEEVDNSMIVTSGVVQSGEQSCTLLVENGRFKGQRVQGVNFLSGSLERDKIFQVGERAMVTISHQGDTITSVVMSDHYRLDKEAVLAALFVLLLIAFAGKKGIQAVFSFAITVLTIWKILVPCYLKGWNPILVGLAVVTFLTLMIVLFVYGPDRRTLIASLGSMLGTLTACLLAMWFTGSFKLHGAIMPNAESLLYSGYLDLNLTPIFMSSVFIGASGAMMDLSVNITTAVAEIVSKKPQMDRREAFLSGMTVGRAAMGTMTTTLLLAYSGSYVTMLMVFMAQGTPVTHIVNYRYVSAEILHTIAGSFGLVTVAPFTAAVSAAFLTRRNAPKSDKMFT